MAYAFKQIEAHDPNNPGLVAPNAMVTIFEPGDAAKTPLTLTTLTGEPLPNPVTVNGLGYGPAFMHATLSQVAWSGGGLTGTFESYEGMRDEAIAARAAAENAATNAAVEAQAAIGDATVAAEAAADAADASALAAANSAALVGAPADNAIATAINAPASETKAALAATYARQDQVAPLVVEALASDATPANAAAAAVSAEIAGRELVERTDPGIPEQTAAFTINGTTRTFISAHADSAGKVNKGTLADGTEFYERSEHNQIKQGDVTSTVVNVPLNIIDGLVDPTGQAADNCIGPDGRFLPETVTSLKRRMGIVDNSNTAALPMDIIIVAGQSNSTAIDILPAGVDPLPIDPRILVWDNASSTIGALSPTDSRAQTFGTSFAREYLKALDAGRSVLLIFNGQGSSGFSSTSISPAPAGYTTEGGGTWDRALTADPNNFYNNTITRANAAKAKAPAGSKIVAWLWSQGESDAGKRTQSEYAALFDDMIGNARTVLSAPNMHVVVGSMVPEWAATFAGADLIEYALEDTPRRLERSAYAPGPADLPDYTNPIHWSSQGQHARGPLFLAGHNKARYNVAGTEPIPPQRSRARRTGSTVIVEWEHPPARFTNVELQYRIDGGTWTNGTVPRPAATTADITGIAPTSTVGIRLRTINAVGTSAYTKEVRA